VFPAVLYQEADGSFDDYQTHWSLHAVWKLMDADRRIYAREATGIKQPFGIRRTVLLGMVDGVLI
jgi:hypothetical protein